MSEVYVFIGYCKQTKEDLFYNSQENKVLMSMNSIILEDDYMNNNKI